MIMADINTEEVAHLLSRCVRMVTCSYCKSYLTSAVRCGCGLACCAACWCGHCASCGCRESPNPDQHTRVLTGQVRGLLTTFQKAFNYNMDTIISEVRANVTNNVVTWLNHSKNHFSPVFFENNQSDWDKIEEMPVIHKVVLENVEPFSEEIEPKVTTPRRSSRKRPLNSDDMAKTVQNEKTSGSSDGKDKGWANVKKMRREFSKLNKNNRSKLNVSIEMCKKTQSSKTTGSSELKHVSPNVEHDVNKENDINRDNDVSRQDSDLDITTHHQMAVDVEINTIPQEMTETFRIPFLLKGKVQPLTRNENVKKVAEPTAISNEIKPPTVNTNEHIIHLDSENVNKSNDEDIHITIKIGSTKTEIVINKKRQVALKTYKDSGIQTSLLEEHRNTSSLDTSTAEYIIEPAMKRMKSNGTQVPNDTASKKTISSEVLDVNLPATFFEKSQQTPVIKSKSCEIKDFPPRETIVPLNNVIEPLTGKVNILPLTRIERSQSKELDVTLTKEIILPEIEKVQSSIKEVINLSQSKELEVALTKEITPLTTRDLSHSKEVIDLLQSKKKLETQSKEVIGELQSKEIIDLQQAKANIDLPLTESIRMTQMDHEDILATPNRELGDTVSLEAVRKTLTPNFGKKCEVEIIEMDSIVDREEATVEKRVKVDSVVDKEVIELDSIVEEYEKVMPQVFAEIDADMGHSENLFSAADRNTQPKDKESSQEEPDSDGVVEGTPVQICKTTSGCHRSGGSGPVDTRDTFSMRVKYHSTPVARGLNFSKELSTQEHRDMVDAFRARPPAAPPCVAGSCLSDLQIRMVRRECERRGWTFVSEFCDALTHLVVSVDLENKAQRSVKYMLSLASGKWIVSPRWMEAVAKLGVGDKLPDESDFEVRDWCGEEAPRLAREGPPLLRGLSFYCLEPYSLLDTRTLQKMITSAGGRVVPQVGSLRDCPPSVLLAEPRTDNHFSFLAWSEKVTPVNMEWLLSCLGAHSLLPLEQDWLLCPRPILPAEAVRGLPVPD